MNEKRNILPSIYLGIKKFYLKFKKICFFSGVIVAIPILLFLIIFLNKKKIRFGKLRRDVIGNATSELFLYLNKKETESEYSDFFYFDDKFVCNKFLNQIGIKTKLTHDSIKIFDYEFSVFETPGHTLDHISYFSNQNQQNLQNNLGNKPGTT